MVGQKLLWRHLSPPRFPALSAEAYGITLPGGTDIVPIVAFGIRQFMKLCAGNYEEEITATAGEVGRRLEANGFRY